MKKFCITPNLLLFCLLCVVLTSCGRSDEHIGDAKTPSASSVMNGRNYQDVVEIFEESGFTNINLEKIEDLVTGWLTKDGEVERVSIGGDEEYSPDVWVPSESEVIIYYHTFADENAGSAVDTPSVDTPIENEDSLTDKESDGFWDFLYKDIEEFEFELNGDGSSYSLAEYNYLSLDAFEQVVIPSTYEGLPVTKIKSQAFYACDEIQSVVIPDSVTDIGSYAFYHCSNLNNISIPESVTTIAEYAFEGCSSLTELNLPHAVDIGFRSFYECKKLETVAMGTEAESGFVVIDGYAFHNCDALQEVTLGPCVSVIDDCAFSYCDNLKTVTVSSGLTKIGSSAFEYCKSLETLTFNGTSDEWLAIEFWPWWNKDTGDYKENILN